MTSVLSDSRSKVALVTGGARRLGRAMVQQLHRDGFRVAIAYRNAKASAEMLAEQLNSDRPDSAISFCLDLVSNPMGEDLVNLIQSKWGRLDVLVNSASEFFPTALGSVTTSQWDLLMDSNVKGAFFLSQTSAPYLAERKGCIVNLVDIYAERPLVNYSVYSITKAALAHLTRAMAIELAPKVRVNGIAPGAILWPEHVEGEDSIQNMLAKIPMGRKGTEQDIAETLSFLVNSASYITGQIIAVDGGRLSTI
jgi:pteridine reductase